MPDDPKPEQGETPEDYQWPGGRWTLEGLLTRLSTKRQEKKKEKKKMKK